MASSLTLKTSLSVLGRILWSPVSNAALRSRKTETERRRLSVPISRSLLTITSAVSALWCQSHWAARKLISLKSEILMEDLTLACAWNEHGSRLGFITRASITVALKDWWLFIYCYYYYLLMLSVKQFSSGYSSFHSWDWVQLTSGWLLEDIRQFCSDVHFAESSQDVY